MNNTTEFEYYSITMTTAMMANDTYNSSANYTAENYYRINESYGPPKPAEFEQFLDMVIVPTMSVLGIVCNLLTLMVLLRSPLNAFSVSVYLEAYCMASAMVWTLITGVGWVIQINNWNDIKNLSDSSCKIWTFVENIVNSSPNCFLIGATIDRIIAVCWPTRAQYMCTVFMAKVGVVTIIIFFTTVAVHTMWTYSLITTTFQYTTCTVTYNIEHHKMVGLIAIPMLIVYMPSILLFFFGNVLIIRLCLKHHGNQLANTSSLDLDLTCTVTIQALVVFAFTIPATLIGIASFDDFTHRQTEMYLVAQYLTFLAYIPLFWILLVRCREFRDAVLDLLKVTTTCFTRSNSNIELRLMNEYNQVPSASTSV